MAAGAPGSPGTAGFGYSPYHPYYGGGGGGGGYPAMYSPEQYQQTVKAYLLGTKTQLTVPYDKAFYPEFARQAQKEILGR